MFIMSSISVAIIVVLLTNSTLSVLLATTFGFVLSQDIFTFLKSPIYLLSLISHMKRLTSIHQQLTTKTFVSFYGWDFQKLSSLKAVVIHYTTSMIKGAVLLGTSLVVVYFTFTSSGETKDLGTRISAGLVIGVFCLLQGSHILQKIYIFGMLRNPLFPKQSENVAKFNKRRQLLHYFSIPGGFAQTYCKYTCTFIVIFLSTNL